MVMRAWTRYAWSSVAAVSALIHVFQSGCFYPDYTFNEPEPSGAGGASGSTTGMSSAGGASTQVSTGAGGSPTTNSATSTSSSSSSASSSGTGGGIVIAPANLIDDMEAGSSNILQQGGRVGA